MFQHTIWKRRSTKNRTENTITITTSSTWKTKGKSSTINKSKMFLTAVGVGWSPLGLPLYRCRNFNLIKLKIETNLKMVITNQ